MRILRVTRSAVELEGGDELTLEYSHTEDLDEWTVEDPQGKTYRLNDDDEMERV